MQSWHLQREVGACVSQTMSSTSCFPSSSRGWGGGVSKQEDFILGNSKHADGKYRRSQLSHPPPNYFKAKPRYHYRSAVGRFWDPESRYFILQSKTLNFTLTWTRPLAPTPPGTQILVAFPAFAARRGSGHQVSSDVVPLGESPCRRPCFRVWVSTCVF